MAHPLENDPRNPCIGCGPANPLGLRLAFARDGDEVWATLRPTGHHQGWPDRLHSGVLYLALLETANWAFYGLTGRVGVPAATGALETRGWVAVGEVVRLTGRLRGPEEVRAAAEVQGREVAALTRRFDVLDKAAFLERMGYAEVPAVFAEAFP